MFSKASTSAARSLFQRSSSFFTKHNNNGKNFEKVTRRFKSNADKEKYFNEYGSRPEYLQNKRKTSVLPLFLAAGLVPLVLTPMFVDYWIRSDREHGDPNLEEYLEHRRVKEEIKKDKERNSGDVTVASAKKTEAAKYKYILIGGGTASYAALKAIKKNDPSAQVLIVTGEEYAPYERPPLSKELWSSNKADELKFVNWLGQETSVEYEPISAYDSDPSTTLLTKTKVVQLDTHNQVVTTSDGKQYSYEKCLIATGGTPRELPGSDLFPNSVTTFRSINDYKKLAAVAKKDNAHIVIVGGSFLGTELSYAVANKLREKKGSKVTQVYLEPDVLARWIPRYLSERVRQTLVAAGVDLKPNRNVVNVEPSVNKDKVVVSLDSGEKIEADYVVTTTGIYPNTYIAEEAGLEIDPQNSGIVTNSQLEAVQNVFVAGDVLSYYDVVLGRRRSEHHEHAEATGRHAGINMSSNAKKPFHHISMFWSDIGDVHFQAVGEINSSLDTYAVWDDVIVKQNGSSWTTSAAPVVASNYGNGIVYYLRDKKVVGILMWNVPDKLSHARKVILEKKQYQSLDELKNKIQLKK
ncbi:hypothetical protein C9374_005404 [Naegleria lovaniensis]|uniref:Uncharacterized protein n=1 Tax=Naegleria lovaniensis TaxID=51637 RepID=A0AA88KIH2_NAELO|nr:uncharacterized protein C9374_005404 [Naegleria lovaniensis]KAG2382202.1 hypothetical protein C9374_005404 [Naegleria lovaniensis]